jgi:hypothetical protein
MFFAAHTDRIVPAAPCWDDNVTSLVVSVHRATVWIVVEGLGVGDGLGLAMEVEGDGIGLDDGVELAADPAFLHPTRDRASRATIQAR